MSPLTACLPFILIFVLLLLTSKLVTPINSALSVFSSSFKISTSANAGNTSFSWVNTPGVIIIIAAVIGGFVQKASASEIWGVFVGTIKQLSKTIITIMSVLAVAKIMTYSGMISDMAALFVAIAGSAYPFIAPIIAALGAFVTGSGTNTEVLLGRLQTEAAAAIGASEYWLAAANSVGAGIGKIVSPQCIATAVAAVGVTGKDNEILNAVLKWALLLLVLGCLLVGIGSMIGIPAMLGVS
jgi:lactate permease